MATCAGTGVICATIELTGDKTDATFVATGETFARTAANCGTTCETEITGLLARSVATSEATEGICEPTAALYGMTAEISVTTGATSVTTAAGKFGRALGGGRRERRQDDSRRRIFEY